MNAVAYVINANTALISHDDNGYIHTTLLTITPDADKPYHIQQTIHRDGSGIFSQNELRLRYEEIALKHITGRHGEDIEMVWVGEPDIFERIEQMVWIGE